MFQNKAVEYYDKNLRGKIEVNNESRLEEQFEDTFEQGAICGYNKASEDFANQLKEVETCNHWQEVAEKANEWHYCKDELPDHNGQFYVALKGQTETFILNYDYDEYDEGEKMVWLDDDDTNFDDEVYAWHEKLEAPKEIE